MKTPSTIEENFFLWLAMNNKLLTCDKLMKRGYMGPEICALCRGEEESCSHLFIMCSNTQEVWHLVLQDTIFKGYWGSESLATFFEQWKSINIYYMEVHVPICWEI